MDSTLQRLTVRRAVREDTEAIVRLEQETFPMPWGWRSIEYDITESEIAIVAVAELDGVFAGYADVWLVAGEGALNNIAVRRAFRGRHIGRRLMEWIMQTLRSEQADTMTLEVRAGNTAAIGLYDRLGFEVVGCRPGYYLDNGEDALLMTCSLTAER